jgi:hypothetical protein
LSYHNIEDYLNATGGYWTPLTGDFGDWKGGFEEDDDEVAALTSQNFDPENPAAELYYVDQRGNQVSEADAVYFREVGTYIAGEFFRLPGDRSGSDRFFPNETGETRHPTPMEGLSDTFAVYLRLGAETLPEREPRRGFFEQHFCQWVSQLIERSENS